MVEKISVYLVLLSAPHTGGRVSVAAGAGGPAAVEDDAWITEELNDELAGAGGAAVLDTTGGAEELDDELAGAGGAAELETTVDSVELEGAGGAAMTDDVVELELGRGTELEEATGAVAVCPPTVLMTVRTGV